MRMPSPFWREISLKRGPHDETVKVTLAAGGKLSVANGGSAVPHEVLERLSHRFERGVTKAEGTGLGLAIPTGTGRTIDLLSPREGQMDGFEVHFNPGRPDVK